MKLVLELGIILGFLGVGGEVIFTAGKKIIKDLLAGAPIDWRLSGYSLLWSFPIYGTAAPIFIFAWPRLVALSWLTRGIIYAVGFEVFELFWGLLLKKIVKVIPWDYGQGRFVILGCTRLDYLPFWSACGFIFEYVFKKYLALVTCLPLN